MWLDDAEKPLLTPRGALINKPPRRPLGQRPPKPLVGLSLSSNLIARRTCLRTRPAALASLRGRCAPAFNCAGEVRIALALVEGFRIQGIAVRIGVG